LEDVFVFSLLLNNLVATQQVFVFYSHLTTELQQLGYGEIATKRFFLRGLLISLALHNKLNKDSNFKVPHCVLFFICSLLGPNVVLSALLSCSNRFPFPFIGGTHRTTKNFTSVFLKIIFYTMIL
jgi:hypothetical protein